MPRGVRRPKAVILEENLAACNERIEKLTRELKEAKAEKIRLTKEMERTEQAQILQAIQESGKSMEEIRKALDS